MLDTPERDELATSLIQLGIDNYGVIKAGGNFAANGGHHSGRKWPIVFAARMLDDCAGAGGSAGSGGAGATGGGASANPDSGDDGGCGCRTSTGSISLASLWLLGIALAGLRRRRYL